ncbi:putative protein OS=Tsukamurella paurometabola (strain ATCC 8368 / DSM / CCUG 35730 /CIP 100753 / JCM 10117 / KCTC 9821 / NBRC 16120 / NCIMB 702349/ NCTC 13040) OX=521096 GN=Tpau_3639 PE=4 SV=1 [Tsukamurella paurometabola]|uniref:Uncharacterized protein n=2 Tax=Tsukamurella paurometabola TaxID=2061 RepID=D5UXY0_TSUPD|nr:hypothetical protein Tpau_3639 [Tsukamurella paurometabola DSM 20162]SUP38878.1 Uncharacterised protein [Tsukamurella paurometabola]
MMTEADRCIRSLALVDSRFQHMCSEHLPERRFTEEQQLRGSKEALSVYVRYWGEAVEESLGRARTLITDEALVQQFTNLHSQAIDVLTLMTDLEGTLTASEPRESYALAREKLLTAAQEHVAATNAFRDSIRTRGAQPQQMPLDPTSRENGQDAR